MEPFPPEALRRYGAHRSKARRYQGFKEDVYLADFRPDARATSELLASLDLSADEALVIVRPPARDALYHRFDNELFDVLLKHLCARPGVRIVLLARTDAQRALYAGRFSGDNLVMPRHALDGATLIAAADLVISAGGTMNREAAALGVPAATIYAGAWAAVDEQLVREGRLRRVGTSNDIYALPLEKKRGLNARRAMGVRAEVADLILES